MAEKTLLARETKGLKFYRSALKSEIYIYTESENTDKSLIAKHFQRLCK